MLLEIGMWKGVTTLGRSNKDKSNIFDQFKTPSQYKNFFVDYASKILVYNTGESYAKVVKMCLDGSFAGSLHNGENWRMLKVFRLEVIDRLEKIANAVHMIL